MKQVTGATNNKPEIKNVSIRLRLDGHSFSEEKLDIPAKEKKTVEIEVLTGKTMLVPREVFDAKAAGPPRCYVPGNSRHPASGYSVMKSWPT